MKRALVCVWLSATVALGQESLDPSVRTVRVVGQGLHGQPIVVGEYGVRIEFEGTTAQPMDYRIRVRHLDAEGRETENVFINDPFRMSTLTAMPHQAAPTGVRTWRWKYSTTIPGPKGLEQLPHSGFYRGWVEEAETGRAVATFDFVRADHQVNDLLRIRQRRLPSAIAPYNEAISASVTIPLNDAWTGDERLNPMLVRSVEVIKNREWARRTSVKVYDDDSNTWVDGAGTDKMTFVAGGILPGNEYRELDLRNLDDYPAGDTLRPRSGADLSRFFFPGRPDHNGLPAYTEMARGADEELTEFQFIWQGDEPADPPPIAIVGEFSGWEVRPEWTMLYDRFRGRYVLLRPLRRGRYDYQYVIDGNDWVRLEGNAWATRNIYTALIVYQDQRFGGFDRIIGVAQVESTGASRGGTAPNEF